MEFCYDKVRSKVWLKRSEFVAELEKERGLEKRDLRKRKEIPTKDKDDDTELDNINKISNEGSNDSVDYRIGSALEALDQITEKKYWMNRLNRPNHVKEIVEEKGDIKQNELIHELFNSEGEMMKE
ncbi:10081_t:CDS:2 [Rhizophagus irregularis]|nr:10081_t:CDS:2 [Rhizophagus irregularis]